jgi:predicted heme/steroid binding protein/uncharacterized membrane protein
VYDDTLNSDMTYIKGGFMKSFTKEELTQYNGQDGQPIYIAHKGNVYDVSESKLWKGGLHMRRHSAGADLTTDIQAAPHDTEVLGRYPRIGTLSVEEQATRRLPGLIAWLLDTNPFFRRHPHPMTVHFPIVFMLSYPVFNLLYWVTGNGGFESTAFHCLGGGIIFLAIAMGTGFLTWWYNYMGRMMKPVAIKICASAATLILAVITFIWRLKNPEVMFSLQGINAVYFFCSLAFVPLISVIGWYGAALTFPIENN